MEQTAQCGDRADTIVAIVVTYHPELTSLEQLITALHPEVDSIVIVDNGSGDEIAAWFKAASLANVHFQPLGNNMGVATAQNSGIRWAKGHGAAKVLIFDQDSQPSPDMLARLRASFAALERGGHKVAAVGPRYVDGRRKQAEERSSFYRQDSAGIHECFPEKDLNTIAVDYLISSGSLTSLAALQDIGGMRDELFIDYVDIEWGLRARSKGWELFGVWDAILNHSLGDKQLKLLGRERAYHSALRYYYMARNAVWLCRQGWVPAAWRVNLAINAVKRSVLFSVFGPSAFTHFRFICRGLWDGIAGRTGRYRG